ncbi:MAG: SMP-30/gluconolactonase/LRE family protein [Pseudomonadota bacterium]
MMRLFDATRCQIGEGPLWHPERQALFWFDILGKRLLMRSVTQFRQWMFEEMVSAAGWVDRSTLLVASETALWHFNIETGERAQIAALEADNLQTRSNDGRADPWGGFWIGTMGKKAEPGAGAIYRFYKGEVTRLFGSMTITNAIAFAPNKSAATFCDTVTGKVMRVALDAETGLPSGAPRVFLDLTAEGLNPDGAVFDTEGCLWLAEWGASRVARYAPDGTRLTSVIVPTPHASCPAFGGANLSTLYVTTAQDGLSSDDAGWDAAGQVYSAQVDVSGQREHQVTLD